MPAFNAASANCAGWNLEVGGSFIAATPPRIKTLIFSPVLPRARLGILGFPDCCEDSPARLIRTPAPAKAIAAVELRMNSLRFIFVSLCTNPGLQCATLFTNARHRMYT
jgi:hypothetical protein